MQWLSQALGEPLPHWKEKNRDCQRCQVKAPLVRSQEYDVVGKCCRFSPFWSGFAAGAWLSEKPVGALSEHLGKRHPFRLTVLGVLHNTEHVEAEGAICGHFKTDSGLCGVWEQRPATCFTFFCASQFISSSEREQKEAQWLEKEASLLNSWFYDEWGGESEHWAFWVKVMDHQGVGDWPQELLFADLSQAEQHYRKMWHWLVPDGLATPGQL